MNEQLKPLAKFINTRFESLNTRLDAMEAKHRKVVSVLRTELKEQRRLNKQLISEIRTRSTSTPKTPNRKQPESIDELVSSHDFGYTPEQPTPAQATSPIESVEAALNRDYSHLMKAIDKKKAEKKNG